MNLLSHEPGDKPKHFIVRTQDFVLTVKDKPECVCWIVRNVSCRKIAEALTYNWIATDWEKLYDIHTGIKMANKSVVCNIVYS